MAQTPPHHDPLLSPAVRDERSAVTLSELRRQLDELIQALDRRTPHIERSGEALIARDAAALRRRAMERLAELDAEARLATSSKA